MKPALALLALFLIPSHHALSWDVTQRKDPLSDTTLVIATSSAKSEQHRETHTLRIVLTRPARLLPPTVEIELGASERAGAASAPPRKQLTFRRDATPPENCAWQALEGSRRIGRVEVPGEADAAKSIEREFADLEQKFRTVWYAEPNTLRTQMAAEARQTARLRLLVSAEKQLVFSSLAEPTDSVAFALGGSYSALRKQLVSALEAHEARRKEQTIQLRRIEALLKRKQDHANLVAERKKKAETYVAKARTRSADSGLFKENLADAVIAAISEIALPPAGFSGICTVEVREGGTVRLYQGFRPDVPTPIATAFSGALANVRRAPEGVSGRYFECHLSFQGGDLGLNIAEVDKPAVDPGATTLDDRIAPPPLRPSSPSPQIELTKPKL